MNRDWHSFIFASLFGFILSAFLLAPQILAQATKGSPAPASKALAGVGRENQPNETQTAFYLREKVGSMYAVACGAISPTDQVGQAAQKAARIALANYSENLARIRYKQLDSARKLNEEQMDPDEKQDRLSALHRQLAQLEALQRVKYSDDACPPPFEARASAEQQRSSSTAKGDPGTETPVADLGNPAADPPPVAVAARQAGTKPLTNDNATACPSSTTIRLTPQKLVFGSQPWATKSDPKTVTIHNTCSVPVTLHLPDPPSSDFQIDPKDCGATVDKDHDCQFEVAYAPFSTKKEPVTLFIPNAATAVEETNIEKSLQSVALAEAKVEEAAARSETEKSKPNNKQLISDADTALTTARAKLSTELTKLNTGAPSIKMEGTPEHWKYPLTRAVAGIDLSAVSSRTVKQAYFVEFNLTAPLQWADWRASYKNEDPLEDRLWVWFNPKITSLPSATQFSALSTINESAGFLDNLKSSSSNTSLVQGLDFSGGFEVAWLKPRNGIPWWAEYPNTRARLAASVIAGFGVSTPFSTSSDDVTSTVNQGICDAFKATDPTKPNTPPGFITCGFKGTETSPRIHNPVDASGSFDTGFTNITFFTPNRSRFFRRYMVGLRLKSFYFNKDVKADCYLDPGRDDQRGDCEAPYDIFPGTIDLTFGKDEAVTAGHLKDWLFRIDAVYPLPFYQGFHAFASVYTALTRNRVDPPFSPFATNTPMTGMNNDANTFRVPLMPLSRDYFRVGVGVDLIQLFKKKDAGGQPNQDQPTAPSSTNKADTKPQTATPANATKASPKDVTQKDKKP
jgi:hypothetical protein